MSRTVDQSAARAAELRERIAALADDTGLEVNALEGDWRVGRAVGSLGGNKIVVAEPVRFEKPSCVGCHYHEGQEIGDVAGYLLTVAGKAVSQTPLRE